MPPRPRAGDLRDRPRLKSSRLTSATAPAQRKTCQSSEPVLQVPIQSYTSLAADAADLRPRGWDQRPTILSICKDLSAIGRGTQGARGRDEAGSLAVTLFKKMRPQQIALALTAVLHNETFLAIRNPCSMFQSRTEHPGPRVLDANTARIRRAASAWAPAASRARGCRPRKRSCAFDRCCGIVGTAGGANGPPPPGCGPRGVPPSRQALGATVVRCTRRPA